MLFNLDKESKKNILENYRREALISSLRKIEQKKKEQEEDKFNLKQKEQRQNEIMELINKEKIFKREKLKNEYNLMLQRTKGFLPRKNQLILKNYGQVKEPFVLPNLYSENSINKKPYGNKKLLINDSDNNNNFETLNRNQREKEILRQVDHMNEFLTDKQNENEMKQYFKKRKENRHLFYKDLLFSQYQDSINKNFNLYGTKDELIIKQKKKKILTDNPYIYNKNYNFGASTLSHNPIVNPENNYNYNKYINYNSYRLIPEKSPNYNNLFKINSMENIKKNIILNENDINGINNRINDWNNNISENHTIDIDYKNDTNKRNKIPFKITKYKLDIINQKYNNNMNGSIFKRNLSQGDIYPSKN